MINRSCLGGRHSRPYPLQEGQPRQPPPLGDRPLLDVGCGFGGRPLTAHHRELAFPGPIQLSGKKATATESYAVYFLNSYLKWQLVGLGAPANCMHIRLLSNGLLVTFKGCESEVSENKMREARMREKSVRSSVCFEILSERRIAARNMVKLLYLFFLPDNGRLFSLVRRSYCRRLLLDAVDVDAAGLAPHPACHHLREEEGA